MSSRRHRIDRSELLGRLNEMLRKISAQSVLISDLVAMRVGLNSTDLECLDLLLMAGPTTAGALSKHTGLTTGATTAVIDRLERAGLVRRRRDAADRRKVLVDVVPEGTARIAPLYAPLAARVSELNEDYDDRQLGTVVEYLSRAMDLGAEHAAWLQTQPVAPRRSPGRRVVRTRTGAGMHPARRGDRPRDTRNGTAGRR